MVMSNEEILKVYNESESKISAIETLAEQNGVDAGIIRRSLINSGIKYQSLPRTGKKEKQPGSRQMLRNDKARRNQIIHDALCCYRERMTAEIEAIKQKYEEAKTARENVIVEIDSMLMTEFTSTDL